VHPTLRIVEYRDPAAFAARALPFLEAREVENCLFLGIVQGWLDKPRSFGADDLMLTVEGDDGPVLVALRAGQNLVVTNGPRAAGEALGTHLVLGQHAIPGVTGPPEAAHVVAERWRALVGTRLRQVTKMAIHRLDGPPRELSAAGRFRAAREDEVDLLTGWLVTFFDEVRLPPNPQPRAAMENSQRAGRLFVWDDGGPVAMAIWGGATSRLARVFGVYTPPARRGRGYAGACVARVCGEVRASGRRLVMLFADRVNLGATRIYRRIGFTPVCDWDHIPFETD
jgi:hypothetical protein